MASDVAMAYDTVQTMADVCGTAADTLNTINTVLMGLEGVLAASAFVGLVGGAIAAEIENIREEVSSLQSLFSNVDNDLVGAIKAVRDGDFSGSQRFV